MGIENNPLAFLVAVDKRMLSNDSVIDMLENSILNKDGIYEPNIVIYKCKPYINEAYHSKILVFDEVILSDETGQKRIKTTNVISRTGLSSLKLDPTEHEKLALNRFNDEKFISKIVSSQRNTFNKDENGKIINLKVCSLSRGQVIDSIVRQGKNINTYNIISFMSHFHPDFFIFDNPQTPA